MADAAGGMDQHEKLSQEARSRLRWRCRRGLLESELIINRWLDKRLDTLTVRDAHTFQQLLDLPDNDLLDLLLGKTQPQGALDTEPVRLLLCDLQQTSLQAAAQQQQADGSAQGQAR